jgi:Na+-translocating ferredoxin:NAD+ oxidoreductase subunit B
MSDNIPIHFVSTHEEARKMAYAHDRFWVSNCGCREGNKSGCKRSRIDICLMYRNDIGASGSGIKEIPLTEVVAIFDEAVEKKLVTRPFRNDKDKSITDGICFCCDDCCGYFLNHEEICDKGKQIETTDMELCNFCGDCVPVCHFDARKMIDNELVIDRDNCYGCGLCLDTCPENAISIKAR